ncbi:pali-domain-containing protein [Mycena metata]|uniref:Pali-domain-containing protein n=1 Tax=Mycena metata TaxID=1033252 RepID=A0AAD7P0U3_9AGAR|nr:pali-domain-containing protein [Mycena metata]
MPSAPSAPLLGLFFTFSATVFLTLVSVSAPTWDKISFLDAASENAIIHFGLASVGYRFNPSSLDFNDRSLHTPVIFNLTRTLILHPIGAGLAALAFLSGISGLSCHRAGTAAMIFFAALTNVVCIMAFLFDMVLFGIVRNSFRAQGISSQYGNACWLTLAAWVSIFLGFSTAACGMFSRYKKRTKRVF